MNESGAIYPFLTLCYHWCSVIRFVVFYDICMSPIGLGPVTRPHQKGVKYLPVITMRGT